jgi:hypothetical protein
MGSQTCKGHIDYPFDSYDDCVRLCVRTTYDTSDEGLAPILCSASAKSCSEVDTCEKDWDNVTNYANNSGSAPSPSHAPAGPSKKECSSLGGSCTSDGDCCGSSARVRCWASHCKSR